MRHDRFVEPRVTKLQILQGQKATQGPIHVFNVGDSCYTPLTRCAAGVFVASTEADYVVEHGTFVVAGAAVVVVRTSLVWCTRQPAGKNQERRVRIGLEIAGYLSKGRQRSSRLHKRTMICS